MAVHLYAICLLVFAYVWVDAFGDRPVSDSEGASRLMSSILGLRACLIIIIVCAVLCLLALGMAYVYHVHDPQWLLEAGLKLPLEASLLLTLLLIIMGASLLASAVSQAHAWLSQAQAQDVEPSSSPFKGQVIAVLHLVLVVACITAHYMWPASYAQVIQVHSWSMTTRTAVAAAAPSTSTPVDTRGRTPTDQAT